MFKNLFIAVWFAVPVLSSAAETNSFNLALVSPSDYQVIQRQAKAAGTVVIAGTILPETKEISKS